MGDKVSHEADHHYHHNHNHYNHYHQQINSYLNRIGCTDILYIAMTHEIGINYWFYSVF